ncbi:MULTISPECIES: 2Fe-2S iron-sulfur cluster-binding protein [unclassified Streptomyces]|uniref:2Fe-2S iron-sulfur cluster-binding protein n=1 Tax=unclassified Streptomyces TaxID=2593676 RepID=UPI0022B70B87|nr:MULTISPECIES: 2Fe-2S iron-sulfur cluster-binding protein [unclassified Streptomyces]MCZ7417819.1 2Fe-2S iron-sulfur cluster-binding protein [Streptomyces sp. WMMC897]MCZ7432376.1 2Fe-2S iron-sulfur cluster-binding protein [Streptomyces sp. WMMC1477]
MERTPSLEPPRDPEPPRGEERGRAVPPGPGFHALPVCRLERLTDTSVAITLGVPDHLAATFAPRPGQHVTVRHRLPGRATVPGEAGDGEIRRSYSVCQPLVSPPPGTLRIVVKRLGPGGFGDHALTRLAVGDTLEVGPPKGSFTLAERPGAHHVLIGGGSGITPLLSMAVAALRDDPGCRVSLVYANRTARSTLLAEEVADLKDRHPGRFTVLHVLSGEERESEVLSGRVDATKLPRLLAGLGADAGDARTHFYLCGPWGLVEAVDEVLREQGADPSRVRRELFTTGPEAQDREGRPDEAATPGGGARITATLHGRSTEAEMTPRDDSLLAAVLRHRPETPYSCRDGLCGSCRARVVGGSVRLDRHYALTREEQDAGYTLACRALPVSEHVRLDFDA